MKTDVLKTKTKTVSFQDQTQDQDVENKFSTLQTKTQVSGTPSLVIDVLFGGGTLQPFYAVGWVTGRASGL